MEYTFKIENYNLHLPYLILLNNVILYKIGYKFNFLRIGFQVQCHCTGLFTEERKAIVCARVRG